MRKILLFALFLSSLLWNAAAHAQERCVEVTLTEAGTLAEKIQDMLGSSTEYLLVNGPVDKSDLTFLKNYLITNSSDSKLGTIDLSCARIENDYLPDNAFMDFRGNLHTLVLPEGLKTIGKSTFENSSIENINIPSTLTAIGERAFCKSEISGKIRFPEGLKVIPTEAFLEAQRISLVELPLGIEEIGDRAFAKSSLYDIRNLGPLNKIKKIGEYAFDYVTLLRGIVQTDFWLGRNLEYIGKGAFSNSNIVVYMDIFPLERIPEELCSGSIDMWVVLISEDVRVIGKNAFRYSELEGVVFTGRTIDEIEEGAFRFSLLKDLTLPEETAKLGNNSFADIPTLQKIYCPCVVPPVNEDAFGGLTPNDIPVYIPVGTLEAYRNAPGWDYFTNFVELAEFPGQSGIEDAVADGADAVRVYAEGGRLRITGVEPGTRYTVYTVDGAMISSGIAEAPAALPAGAVYVVKVDGKGYKVKI